MHARQFKDSELSVPSGQAYRKSLQRLRWFRSTFEEQVDAIQLRTDIKFRLNPEILTECFVQWIRIFEQSKPMQLDHRPAFVGYSAGLMLRELVTKKPLSVVSMPQVFDESLPEYFWPEGFVYVAYCLDVRQAVLQNDFGVKVDQSPALDELRTWWSFRENLTENPNYAISFFDLFAGEDPNWSGSGFFNGSERTAQLEKLIAGQLPPS